MHLDELVNGHLSIVSRVQIIVFFILFWGCFSWKWCTIYLFLDSLTWKLRSKFGIDIFNVSKINFIDCITWPLKHSFMGQKLSYFLFFTINLRFFLMKLLHDIFFYFLTSKLWNKIITDIFNVSKTNFINFITWPLKHFFKGWKHSFFIFYY